jgi:hypothetical protein
MFNVQQQMLSDEERREKLRAAAGLRSTQSGVQYWQLSDSYFSLDMADDMESATPYFVMVELPNSSDVQSNHRTAERSNAPKVD